MVGTSQSGLRVERGGASRRRQRLTRDEITRARAYFVAGLHSAGVTLADAGAILGISETKACRLKSRAQDADTTLIAGLLGIDAQHGE